MVHERWIKKGGKLHGPYYYESYRENGKVKKRYIGRVHPNRKRKFTLHFLVIATILFFLSIFGFYYLNEGNLYGTNLSVIFGRVISENFSDNVTNILNESNEKEVSKMNNSNFGSKTTSEIGNSLSDSQNFSGLSLTKKIPLVRVSSGESYELNLSKYFLGAEDYDFFISDFSVILQGEIAELVPDNGFTGATKGKVIAIKGNKSLESNEFTILVSSNSIYVVTEKKERIVIGKPVKWVKNVSIDSPGEVKVELPDRADKINVKKVEEGVEKIAKADVRNPAEEKNMFKFFIALLKFTGFVVSNSSSVQGGVEVILKDNATQYVIEYETPAPLSFEENTDSGKKIIISAPDELNYTDVLSYTNLPEILRVGQENEVVVRWVENSSEISFDVYDLDGNDYLDYVEWITPHLSNQTFEIILISDAVHLDSGRGFVENVYEFVNERDDNWTTIPEGHYLRVTFEENLTSRNDITIYAKTNVEGASVDVYEANGEDIVASFDDIYSYNDKEYKIYLTNLQGEQDTFDLRISGGDVEFDYVVDPQANSSSTIYQCGTIDSPGVYTLNQSISSTGTCLDVLADNVTIDCQGYWIDGDRSSLTDYGVKVDGYHNVAIKHCRVRDFGRGVLIVGNGTVFYNNTMYQNMEYGGYLVGDNFNFSYNNFTNTTYTSSSSISSSGLYIKGDNGTLQENVYAENGVVVTGLGIVFAYGLFIDGSNITIRNDVARDNVGYVSLTRIEVGFRVLADDSYLENVTSYGHTSQGDGTGVYISGSRVNLTGSNIYGNGYTGVDLDTGSGSKIYGNAINHSGGNLLAIEADQAGLVIEDNIILGDLRLDSVGNISRNIIRSGKLEIRSSDSYFVNNNISGGLYGIYLSGSQNNTINGTIVQNVSYAIYLTGNFPNNNTLIDTSIWNANVSDFYFNNPTNKTRVVDTVLGIYNFTSTGERLILEERNSGSVEFTSPVNGSGTNLTRDIAIGNNSVNISASENIGLNKSANVTLYGIGDRGFENPVVLRNNETCGDCYNFTSLTAGTVIFNISGEGNYTIGGGPEIIPPNVTINFPSDGGSYGASDLPFNFNVSLSENGSISYSLDGGANNVSMLNTADGVSLFGTLFNSSNGSIADGSYTFSVYANDTLGNKNYTESVDFTLSTSVSDDGGDSGGSSSSGGGGGGGTTTSTSTNKSYWIRTIFENNQELKVKGRIIQHMSSKERVSLNISGESHYVGVLDVSSNSALIEVASSPQQARLSIGENKSFEVTGDGFYDLSVKLDSITNNKAAITVRHVEEKVPLNLEESNETSEDGGGGVDDPIESPLSDYFNGDDDTIWIVLIAIVIINSFVIVWWFIKRAS